MNAMPVRTLFILLVIPGRSPENYAPSSLLSAPAPSHKIPVLIVLGINHKTASVDLREQVLFEPGRMREALVDARAQPAVAGVAVLSTCNRTEVYAEVVKPEAAHEVLKWMAQWHGLNNDQLQPVHYLFEDSAAAAHLMKVASGLDSLILGEPQILGQLKSAYAVALEASTLSSGLHRTFHLAFSMAKKVRTETAIGKNPVSVAYAAVALARQIFSELNSKTAMLIGAGETIRLASQHLVQQGLSRLIIANRTLDRAQQLAEDLNGDGLSRDGLAVEVILLSEIPEHLHRADILISSTASQLPILGKGAVESALKQRKHSLMFMVDIAVPRDIEAQVDELDDVYLFTVDDLGEVIEENRRSREDAAAEATQIIDNGVSQWLREERASGQAELIRLFRDQAGDLRDAELKKAIKSLESGEQPAQVVERLAHALTNKFLHRPTAEINRAIGDGQNEVVDLVASLFGLDTRLTTIDQDPDERLN